ncbi:histone-lysine N-methyltransferase SMYD3 [Lepeophtheirus salmonis]|uniref:SET and MYND domain-containing protein 3 n=1 Tax=Lepeophtheirus salmonis TaxID=72036 RepID=C1BRW7_LEPSM|nr:histone-lysine N-methyltransferase SMYD3-like [Lepeophtheirus salmonis]ACO11770.1 SET and MYND domain-containing protein 3 [Lepeophtheirus salmonis]
MVYKMGDEVLRCRPFSYAFKEKNRDKICDYCFSSRQAKILRCSRCCIIYYCGRQCQRLSWSEIHKKECKYLKMLDLKEPPLDLLFIVRTLCKLKYDGGYSKEVSLPNGRSRKFIDLMSHKENILMNPEHKKRFLTYLDIIIYMLGGSLETNESEVLNIFTKLMINASFMLNEKLIDFGGCLCLEFSAIDHSCRPNAIYMFNGHTLVVKALCEIANFDDVRVAYVDMSQPRSIRQELLKNQFFFDCNCEECAEDPLNLEKLKSHSPCCPECQHLLDGTKCMNCNQEVDLARYYQIKEILIKEKKVNAKTSLYFKEVCKYFHSFDYVSLKYCNELIAIHRSNYNENELQIIFERILLAKRKYGCFYDIFTAECLMLLMMILLNKEELKSLPNLLLETKTVIDLIYPRSHSIFHEFNDVNLMFQMIKNK